MGLAALALLCCALPCLVPLLLVSAAFRSLVCARVRRLLFWVVRHGGVPRHVAFIMDGNRRFATSRGLPVSAGHSYGYEALMSVLTWCLELGVRTVTVYAFSIENYRRTKEEVDALMRLFMEKLSDAVTKRRSLAERGVRVRVLGDTSLLPEDVVRAVRRATEAVNSGSQETRATLNVCLSYTSREEIASAISSVVRDVRSGNLSVQEVDEGAIEKRLYCDDRPDVVIRTSGEWRLSDFLLWQSCHSCFLVTSKLWPAITYLDLLGLILQYHAFARTARPPSAVVDD